eukprot:3679802-Amphidinium_carterae.1
METLMEAWFHVQSARNHQVGFLSTGAMCLLVSCSVVTPPLQLCKKLSVQSTSGLLRLGGQTLVVECADLFRDLGIQSA